MRISPLGTDGEMDSEEFYDVHTDDEDDTLRETANGHVGILDLDDVRIHTWCTFHKWALPVIEPGAP